MSQENEINQECVNCGLTRATCEMEGGNEWVKNCKKIEGKKHVFDSSPITQEKKCYCPCTVSDLCTCQKCIVGFHMPSPIVEEWDKQARNLHEGIVEEKEGWEIKFDEKFTYVGTTSIFHEAKHRELKSFISQTLAEERERLVKEIEDYRIGWADTNEENNCCREIINIIKNNK